MSTQTDLIPFTFRASASAWTFFALAAVAFGLRTISRIWYIETPFGWEDVIISIFWALDVVRMVTFAIALSWVRQVTPENVVDTVPHATFWALFTDSWSFLSVTLPKVAVAFLLIRIFRPRPWIRSTFLGVSIGLFIICIAGFIICFVQCNPVAGQWDPYSHPDVVCWARNVQIDYSLAASACSTAVDFVFAIYPTFVIAKLQMRTWKKVCTIALMGIGLTAFAVGVVKVSQNGTLLGNPDLNALYVHTMSIGLWNSIENDLIIIAACAPLLPAIFRRKDAGSKVADRRSGSRKFAPNKSAISTGTQGEGQPLELATLKGARSPNLGAIHVQYEYKVHREGRDSTGEKPASSFSQV